VRDGRRQLLDRGIGPSWSNDGSRIVFLSAGRFSLSLLSLPRHRVVASFERRNVQLPAAWSPADDSIAYAVAAKPFPDDPTQIAISGPAGAHPTRVTHDRTSESVIRIVWASRGSERGRRMYYIRGSCDLEGGNPP
jgi:Tol biopolymer transport system component